MTVPSAPRSAGPFVGNGVTTAFPFTFKVFSAADVAVYHTDANDVQTLLASNYTVVPNADQDISPGGTLNYPTAGAPLSAAESLALVGDLDYVQGTDITNAGRFLAQVFENVFDYLTILIQQLVEKAGRMLSFPVGDTASGTLPSASVRANKALVFDPDGNASVSVDDYDDQLANVTSQAGIAATQAGLSTAQAGISTVQAAASAASAAAALASLNDFKGRWYGALAANPTVDPLGNPIGTGDAYFNNVSKLLMVYNGATWQSGSDINMADLAASGGAALVGYQSGTVSSHLARLENGTLDRWFAGGIANKKIVLVGDSTTDFAYGLHRALLNYYTRRGRELESVAVLNYGTNGQTLAAWLTDGSRYGKAGTIAENADLYVLDYGINDVRLGATTEDALVALLEQAVDALIPGVPTATVLLRVPNTFTTTDTSAFGFVSPNTAAQSYSTLLRNAYKRVAVSRSCPLLDTQELVFGLTSMSDVLSPYMLNQIHANDAGNQAVARALVKMIGMPAKGRNFTFAMRGKLAVGAMAKQVVNTAARVAFGFADYKPSAAGGSLTLEMRKYPVGGGASVQIGTVTYSGGTSSTNVMTPGVAVVDWTALVAGDAIEVSVTACTVESYDLEVFLVLDESPPSQTYPLLLRGSGLVSSLDASVVYAATQALPTAQERTIGTLKAVHFWRLGTNRFTKYSNDATQNSAWSRSNVTVTGSPGSQVITATATNCAANLSAPVTAGEQLTYSWKATGTGSPTYAVFDITHGTFIVAVTAWPAADGQGWRNVTFTVPAGCTTIKCYPIASAAAIGDSVTLTNMQLSVGAARTQDTVTNAIGTSMVVNTGALPTAFTRIHLVKVDAFAVGQISVVGPGGPLASGNPGFQAVNSALFGYPAIATRGTAPRGAAGAWQPAVLRYTGGNSYVTVNDQGQSIAYAGVADAVDLRWNLLSATDTTGSFQNWDGEIISEFYPYLLSEGETTARVRALLRTLQANGETITADWPAQKLF